MKIKAILTRIMRGFNAENLAKTNEIFTKSINTFDSGLKEFGKSMDSITRELSSDVEQSNTKSQSESKKNQENLKELFGDSKVKLWDDKPFKL